MKMRILPLGLVLAVSLGALPAGFVETTDSGSRVVAWLPHLTRGFEAPKTGDRSPGPDTIDLSGSADLTLASQIPFKPEMWERLYLTVLPPRDPVAASGPFRTDSCYFLSVNFHGRQFTEYPDIFASFAVLRQKDGTFTARVNLSPSIKTGKKTFFSFPCIAGTARCLEFRYRLPAPDTVDFTLFVDGDSLFRHASAYYPVKTILFQAVSNTPRDSSRAWGIRLNAYALSGKRIHGIPSAPTGLTTQTDSPTVKLRCAPYRSPYAGETVSASEYSLEQPGFPGFPLYFDRLADPRFHYERRLPFPLDSGVYFWRMRFRNNFNAWGGWSVTDTLHLTTRRRLDVRVQDLFLSEPGKEKPLPLIEPDRIFDFHVRFSKDTRWDRPGFLLITLTRHGYPFANAGNRGGFFLPESNYTLNLSFEDRFPLLHRFQVFEKIEGTQSSRALVPGRATGRYFVGTQDKVRFNGDSNEVVFSLRLLPQARPGPWMASASVYDSADLLFNTVRRPFRVAPAVRNGFSRPLISGLIFALLAAALFLWVRRRKPPVPKSAGVTPDMKRISDYLLARLAQDITVEQVRKDLRLSAVQFYKILKEHRVASIPRLQNQLRVERARELIRTSAKTLSEICFEVGFKEPPYFTKVFKEFTGVTPSDYRRSLPPENPPPPDKIV